MQVYIILHYPIHCTIIVHTHGGVAPVCMRARDNTALMSNYVIINS